MEKNAFQFHGIRITTVFAIPGTRKIYLSWNNGEESVIEYQSVIDRYESLTPLKNDNHFQSIHIADDGWCLEWNEDISVGADSLRQLAEEQGAIIERRKVV